MPRQAKATFPFDDKELGLRGSVLIYAPTPGKPWAVRLRLNRAPVVIEGAYIQGYGAGHTKYSSVTIAPNQAGVT
jgi:hypothetical protein